MTPIQIHPDVRAKIQMLNTEKRKAESKVQLITGHLKMYLQAVRDTLEIPPEWEFNLRYGEFRPPPEPMENKSTEAPVSLYGCPTHPPAVRIKPTSARDQAG